MIFNKNNLPKRPWIKYRKKHLTEAIKIPYPFAVATREGVLQCDDGYLAVDSYGWPYPIASDEFQKTYEIVKEEDA